MQAFFKPGSAINKDHKEKYLHILAYAASVYDNEDGERSAVGGLGDLMACITFALG